MKTQLPRNKKLQSACNTIHEFFDCYGLKEAIRTCELIIRAAGNQQPWQNGSPDNVLLFIEKLGNLCAAAITISKAYTIKTAVVQKTGKHELPNLSRTKDFVSSLPHSNAWDCLPRSLTGKQYKDPGHAIKKFIRSMPAASYKKILKDIQTYALSKAVIDEAYSSGQLLKIRLRLLQLIEACHLIEVRVCVPGMMHRHQQAC